MITYLKGDATDPIGENKKCIIHITNDAGAWGAGFVMALSKRWSEPEAKYRSKKPILGEVDFVCVELSDIIVANMCAQVLKYSYEPFEIPLKYDYLMMCLCKVRRAISLSPLKYDIHLPKIGSGLAGGNWKIIECMINEVFYEQNVFIYELV